MYKILPEEKFKEKKYQKYKNIEDGLLLLSGIMNLEGKRKWRYNINDAKIIFMERNKEENYNEKTFTLKNFPKFDEYFNNEDWNISDNPGYVETEISIPIKILF